MTTGAGEAVQAAAVAALAADPGLAGVAVVDAPPARAGYPTVVVGEPVLADCGAVGVVGRDVVLTATARDAGERPTRLRSVAWAMEGALLALAPDGWTVAAARLTRSRIVRAGSEWVATVEVRVRVFRA